MTIQKNKITAILMTVIFTVSLLPNLLAAQNENRPKVIFIQDAHSNYEAQSQIRDILKNIVPGLQPVTILVEGTSKSLDSSIFQFTSSGDLNKQITEKLSEKGLVSGAELFTLEPESASAQFAGLENPALYQKEKTAFMSVISRKLDTDPLLSILDSRLDALKSRVFNPKLKEIDRKFSAYKNGKIALLSWFDYLRKLVPGTLGFSLNDPRQSVRYPNLVRLSISYAASQNMDMANLETEKKELAKLFGSDEELVRFVNGLGVQKEGGEETAVRLYETSKKLNINWLQFPETRKAIIALLLSNEMQGEGLFYELENLKNEIYKQLARTEEEKKIVSLDHDLRFLSDMLSLGSTREVWSSVKERKDSLKPVEWMRRFNEIDLGSKKIDPKRIEILEETFEHAFDFYDLAEKREGVFMNRIQETLKNNASGNVIVVSGGFHAEGLERAFRNQNLDFSVIQPELHKKSDLTHYYQAVFQSETLPFLASKMAAEPFNESNHNAEVLAEILARLKDGTLPVTIPKDQQLIEEVNASPFMVRNGGRLQVTGRRFQFEPSAQSLGISEEAEALKNFEALSGYLSTKSKLSVDIKPTATFKRAKIEILETGNGPKYTRVSAKFPVDTTPEAALNALREREDLPLQVHEAVEKLASSKLNVADITNLLGKINAEFPETLDIQIKSTDRLREKTKVIYSVVDAEGGVQVNRIEILIASKAVPEEVLGAILDRLKFMDGNKEVISIVTSLHTLALQKAPEFAAQNPDFFAISVNKPAQAELFSMGAETPAQTAVQPAVSETAVPAVADEHAHLFPMTDQAIEALNKINRTPAFTESSVLEFDDAYLRALSPEKIGIGMTVAKNAKLAIRGADVIFGSRLFVRGRAEIEVASAGRLIVGNDVTLGNVKIIVGAGQTVIIGNKINLIGNIETLPFTGEVNSSRPALIVGDNSQLKFTSLAIAPGGQLEIPPGTKANTIENLNVPANMSLKGLATQNNPGGISGPLKVQPNLPVNLQPTVPIGQSLGNLPKSTPVNRITNFTNPVNPRPVPTPVPVPTFIPSLDQGGNFQDFIEFTKALRAAVPPSGISTEKTSEILDAVSTDSVLLKPLIESGVVSLDVNPNDARLTSMQASLGGISRGAAKQFLSRLIQDVKKRQPPAVVLASIPNGIYSMNDPKAREVVEFYLDNRAVIRVLHFGTRGEVDAINKHFARFNSEKSKRFEAVLADKDHWKDQLRGVFGEDLLKAIQQSGRKVDSLEELYRNKDVAVSLPKALWMANPELPSVSKVTSLADDSQLGSKARSNSKLAADLAYMETALAQLVSIYQGNFKELLQVVSYQHVFSYSESERRFSLNMDSILSNLLEGIHEQALALQKLAYNA